MSHQEQLGETIRDRRAWTADSIGPMGSWDYRLPDGLLKILEAAALNRRRAAPCPVTEIRLDETELLACRQEIQPALDALESGPGFVVIQRVLPDSDCTSTLTPELLYWLVGQCIGPPFEQNIEGTLLYDVRDTGNSVTAGSRFSVTNAESSFHIDAAFANKIPDYIGLLCLQTAKSGGRSQLLSGYSLHNELLAKHPDILPTLYEPFCFDRRGQFAPGELPYSRHPLLRWDGRELTMRYLHYYIEVGHEKAAQALTPAQQNALGIIENLLSRPDLRVEFDLQPGQMIFVNNHWILHNRTAFEDHADPKQRRHYVRLWLSRAMQAKAS